MTKTKKINKRAILKFSKITLLLFIVFMLPLSVIAGYEYFKVIDSPKYNPETMPLNYEVIGLGEKRLVFIHGLTGSMNYWKRDLEAINQAHKLLLIDLLGFGDSPKPNSDYSLDTQLKALEKVIIKEKFNDGKTIIVGHSMGSTIALALFAKHKDWFEGAVITGLPVYKNEKEFKEIMSGHAVFDRIVSSKYAVLTCLLHPIFINSFFKPDNLTDEVFNDAKKHNWQSFSYSLKEIVIQTDLYAITKEIKDEKIIFIHGDLDTSAPFQNAKRFAETFTNAEFITVKNGDHQLFLKDPNILWKAINQFPYAEIKNNKPTDMIDNAFHLTIKNK
jgi:pimeloyl-ACP methyl ester carboxylesterase